VTGESSKLATERLVLREPVAADAPALLAYHRRNAERLTRWDPPRGTEVEQHRRWIEWRDAERACGRGIAWLAFARTAEAELVGQVQLDGISREPQPSGMLAYSVDGAFEGQGYAAEAVAAVIAYAFGELGLDLVNASYDPANERSGALLRRLGFAEVVRTPVVPGFERHLRAQVLVTLARAR
jgi:ribosomal-protein-alanine N-acetyltransferase